MYCTVAGKWYRVSSASGVCLRPTVTPSTTKARTNDVSMTSRTRFSLCVTALRLKIAFLSPCHAVSLVPLDHPFLNCEATGVSARLAVEGVVQVRETIKGVSAQTVSNLPTRRIVLVENGTGREPNCRPVNENGRHPLPFLTYTPPMQKFQRHNIL